MTTEQPEYVKVGLEQVASEQGFTPARYRIEYESGSNKGDGFLGTLFKAFIREDGRDEFIVLVKVLPEQELRKQQSLLMFHREAMVYNMVLPMFRKFQAEKGISEKGDDCFWRVPKVYYASCDLEKKESVIIMEDLREKKFRMWNKYEPVDFDHTRLLLEELGKLHAVSFAMKDQQPEQFAHFKMLACPMKTLIDMDPKRNIDGLFAQMYDRAVGTLAKEDTTAKERMEKLKGIVTESYIECVTPEEPYAIIGHGDCWVNNMMYTYDGNEPTPTDIRLIDWQLCRYVSPVLDLSYFIFICTDEELRAKHYDELLDIYYKSLGAQLKRLGGDVERQFPRDAFEAQWKKYGQFGLLMGLILLPMISTANEDLPDMEKYMEKMEKDEKDIEYEYGTSEKAFEMYRKRMSGMIRDVVRLEYL